MGPAGGCSERMRNFFCSSSRRSEKSLCIHINDLFCQFARFQDQVDVRGAKSPGSHIPSLRFKLVHRLNQ